MKFSNYLNEFRIISVSFSVIIFLFTSIFTILTIANSWTNSYLSSALLICYLANLFLFVCISVLKIKNKTEREKDFINIANILRKLVNLGNVFLTLIITFMMLDSDVISLFMKIVMSGLSFSIAIMYILLQLFIMMIRGKKNKFINYFKTKKEGYR